MVVQVVIGTKVGRAKHMRIMPGGALEADKDLSSPSSIFVGRKLDEHRGAFLLEYPMDKGYVSDGGWDAMERLWEVRRLFDA
jgi:centractin